MDTRIVIPSLHSVMIRKMKDKNTDISEDPRERYKKFESNIICQRKTNSKRSSNPYYYD